MLITSQFVFIAVTTIVVCSFFLSVVLSLINMSRMNSPLPESVKDVYEPDRYIESQKYLKEKTRLSLISKSILFVLIIGMLFGYGFAFVDDIAARITDNSIAVVLVFFGILMLATELIGVPFELYETFSIERRYGFNTTKAGLYVADKIKSLLLSVIVGGGILALIVLVYETTGLWFIPIVTGIFVIFGLLMSLFYTTLIIPLFNKLSPLPEGELRTAIEKFASQTNFPLSDIKVIDNSKRSKKSNAWFSGLGKRKKIVLYDTLIENHSIDEIVAVLAHETGHFKKKHILTGMFIGLLQMIIMLVLLYLFLHYPVFQFALGVKEPSFHMGLVIFALLYSPLSLLMGIGGNYLSRRNEYQADAYAASHGQKVPLIAALKKLSSHNLSNMTPHPLYVAINYTHPPLTLRIEALQQSKQISSIPTNKSTS